MSPVTMRIIKPISLESNYPPVCFYLNQGGKSRLPYYPKCRYSRLIQSVNLIELWYEAERSGQSDVWKKNYLSPADLRQ